MFNQGSYKSDKIAPHKELAVALWKGKSNFPLFEEKKDWFFISKFYHFDVTCFLFLNQL